MQQLDWKGSNSLGPKRAIQYCILKEFNVIGLGLLYFVAAFLVHNYLFYLHMNVNGIVHVKYNFFSIPFVYQQAKPIMCKT
jgi:hypothetical protein